MNAVLKPRWQPRVIHRYIAGSQALVVSRAEKIVISALFASLLVHVTSIIPVFTVFKDTAITKGLVFWILRGVTKLYINACVKCKRRKIQRVQRRLDFPLFVWERASVTVTIKCCLHLSDTCRGWNAKILSTLSSEILLWKSIWILRPSWDGFANYNGLIT